MFRRISILFAALSLMASAASSVLAADNVAHYPIAFSEESAMSLDPEVSACVGYAGTIYEQRTYDVRITEFVDGPNQGMVHLTGVIMGAFTIAPAEGEPEPSYTGSYREKVTLIGTSLDSPEVFSFTLPASATGSDGSTLKFLLRGHGVTGQDGKIKLLKFQFNCIRNTTDLPR